VDDYRGFQLGERWSLMFELQYGTTATLFGLESLLVFANSHLEGLRNSAIL
jgi:hypothetical protein